MTYPFVEEEFQTIRTIIERGASIARYGDGELKLCYGNDQIAQTWCQEIGDRLKEILKLRDVDSNGRMLVGIPRIVGRDDFPQFNPNGWKFWSERYTVEKVLHLYSKNKEYYSAFISRPDSAIHIHCIQYWDMVRSIWEGKKVVVVEGEDRRFEKTGVFLNNAKRVDVVKGPKRDAFDVYDDILSRIKKYKRDRIIILALGPTATVLAYDLFLEGFQALDLGHMGMFFRKGFKFKSLTYKVRKKGGGDDVNK